MVTKVRLPNSTSRSKTGGGKSEKNKIRTYCRAWSNDQYGSIKIINGVSSVFNKVHARWLHMCYEAWLIILQFQSLKISDGRGVLRCSEMAIDRFWGSNIGICSVGRMPTCWRMQGRTKLGVRHAYIEYHRDTHTNITILRIWKLNSQSSSQRSGFEGLVTGN